MKQIQPSAINATIAELMEPKPDFSLPELHSSEWAKRDLRISLSWDGSTTASGIWVWKGLTNGSWQPLDFLHDARGTVMLFEKLLEDDKRRQTTLDDLNWSIRRGKTFKNWAVRYFLRANGIEVSE